MNTFLTKELLLWIQAKYRVHKEAKHTTIAGFSLGGIAAFMQHFKIHIFLKCVVNVWIRTLGKG